jgi:hypothetical protein
MAKQSSDSANPFKPSAGTTQKALGLSQGARCVGEAASRTVEVDRRHSAEQAEGGEAMSTDHENAMRALKQLEAEQVERFRPKPERPRTSSEALLDHLNASCSTTVSVDVADAGWLR